MTNSKNKAATDAIKGYEQAIAYGKENVDAVMKSNAIFVKGLQDINTVLFGLAQTSLEDSVAATQKLFGCKTVADVMDTQADLAKTGYAKAIEDQWLARRGDGVVAPLPPRAPARLGGGRFGINPGVVRTGKVSV